MTPQQWSHVPWLGPGPLPQPPQHWYNVPVANMYQGGRQHVTLVEIGMRKELAGLKAAQNIEPTAVRAEMIARLEVELQFM